MLLTVGGDARGLVANAVAFFENPQLQRLRNLADAERRLIAIQNPLAGQRSLRAGQLFQHQVAIFHHAPLVVLLQGDVTGGERILVLDMIHHLLVVHENLDVVAVRDDMLREPGVGRHQLLQDLDEVIQAAGAYRIAMRAVHLRFITSRKTGSERGAEIHPGISAVADLHLRLELAVDALLAHVEKMAGFSVAGDVAVANGPRFGPLVGFPAVQCFSVVDRLPAVGRPGAGGECEQEKGSHMFNPQLRQFIASRLARRNPASRPPGDATRKAPSQRITADN